MGPKKNHCSASNTRNHRPIVLALPAVPVDIDLGVHPKDCIKIFLVSSKEEFVDPESFVINPVDLNAFFYGGDGKIYGYQGLKINVWISSISFHAYADIKFQKSSNRGKGITSLKSALQTMLGKNLVESKDEFLQTFIEDKNFLRTTLSNGEVLVYSKAFGGHDDGSSSHSNSTTSNIEVVRMMGGNMATGHLYSRLLPLVLLLVDDSTPIDAADPCWGLYLLIHKETDLQEEIQCRLIGFAAVYRFYRYPDSSRLRLSQMLVLPSYQHQGYGRYLLEVLNDVAINENIYDLTVVNSSSHFQFVRICVDIQRLLHCERIQHSLRIVVSILKEERLSERICYPQLMPPDSDIEGVRESLKINKKQFGRCWEVLVYLGIHDPLDKHMDEFSCFIFSRMKKAILGKHSGNSGKQLIEVPHKFEEGLVMGYVMFRSGPNEANTVQMSNTPNLKKMVEDRVKEIQFIAAKVSPHLENLDAAVTLLSLASTITRQQK